MHPDKRVLVVDVALAVVAVFEGQLALQRRVLRSDALIAAQPVAEPQVALLPLGPRFTHMQVEGAGLSPYRPAEEGVLEEVGVVDVLVAERLESTAIALQVVHVR